MRTKAIALVCLGAVVFTMLAVPAAASPEKSNRPPVDGGYVLCHGNTLISELGIRFRHSGFPGSPTVFHVLPAEAGRSLGEELLEAITPTTRPSKRTGWLALGALLGYGVIAGSAAGISYFFDIKDSRDGKFERYIAEFYDCLNSHPRWQSYLFQLMLSSQKTITTVKSWESIEMQLLCHAAGAALPDPGTILGGLTWDLEGHMGKPFPSIDPLDLVVTSGCQWDQRPFSWIPIPWG